VYVHDITRNRWLLFVTAGILLDNDSHVLNTDAMRISWSIFLALILLLLVSFAMGWFSHDFFVKQQVQHASMVDGMGSNPVATSKGKATVPPVSPTLSHILKQAPASPVDPLQSFRTLMVQGYFTAAMQVWPHKHTPQARRSVLALVRQLSRDGRTESALRLLREYRNGFPEDIEAGLLHANILHQSVRFDQETFLLFGLLNQTADPGLLARIRRSLKTAVQSHDEHLKQREEYGQILVFFRKLAGLDGGNPDYQMMQATTLIKMGQLQQASTILQPLVFDAQAGSKAKELLQRIKQVSDAVYQITVPLQRAGEHFLVSLSINGRPPVRLLLDTGASITLLQRNQVAIADSTTLPKIALQTANGRMQALLMKSNRIRLGSFQLQDVDIALIEGAIGAGAEGLLGMNILKHFDFFIDQQTPALKLSRRGTHKF